MRRHYRAVKREIENRLYYLEMKLKRKMKKERRKNESNKIGTNESY